MHNKIKGRKLGRTASHRKALLRNLANQLFEHKEIKTTIAKAKEARSKVERLITYAKKGDLHHRRLAFAFLRNKQTINILFDEIAPVYSDRQGGYTRVVKLGRRSGDGAEMSLLQLVDFEKLGDVSKSKKKKPGKTKKVEKETVDQKEEIKETEKAESTEPVETAEAEEKTDEEEPSSGDKDKTEEPKKE
jgi:large subunit ribosomal protein L17